MHNLHGCDSVRVLRPWVGLRRLSTRGTPAATRVLASGFQQHVAKPFEPSELIAAVASLGGRRLSLSPPG